MYIDIIRQQLYKNGKCRKCRKCRNIVKYN